MSIMIVIEKEKRLSDLILKNQKYFSWIFATPLLSLLFLQLRFQKLIQYFSLLFIPIIIILIVIMIILIIINNLFYYLVDFVFNFIII